jgi:hypothetical protein
VNKYGINDLSFFLLHDTSWSKMVEDETFFIGTLDPYFNLRKIIDGIPDYRSHITDEYRKRLSLAHIGKKSTPEARKKQSETNKRIGLRPPPMSSERKEQLSKEMTIRLTGHVTSQETKDKISNTLMGHEVSVELRGLISAKTRESMIAKGYNTRLFSDSDLQYIRSEYMTRTSKSLCEEFGVSEGVIYRIVADIKKGHRKSR